MRSSSTLSGGPFLTIPTIPTFPTVPTVPTIPTIPTIRTIPTIKRAATLQVDYYPDHLAGFSAPPATAVADQARWVQT